jgi:hypothetical protein
MTRGRSSKHRPPKEGIEQEVCRKKKLGGGEQGLNRN